MFNRLQRNELEILSQAVFDDPNHYRRIQKRFRVNEGVGTTTKSVNYLRLKSGQIVTATTAMAMGLVPSSTPTSRDVYYETKREATFEELKYALESALESKDMSGLSEVDLITKTVLKMHGADLINQPFLVVEENDEAAFMELLSQVATDHQREALLSRKVPNGNKQMFCLPGVKFLSEFVFFQGTPTKEELEAVQ